MRTKPSTAIAKPKAFLSVKLNRWRQPESPDEIPLSSAKFDTISVHDVPTLHVTLEPEDAQRLVKALRIRLMAHRALMGVAPTKTGAAK